MREECGIAVVPHPLPYIAIKVPYQVKRIMRCHHLLPPLKL
jgi:hypothetical protein